MQRLSVLVFFGLGIAVSTHAAGGCADYANDCRLNNECCPDGTMACFSSGTGGNPACAGEPSDKNVTEDCGVFAQADAAGATEDGTKAHPYKSLQKAIDNAGGKRVYACASAPFGEAVTLASGLEVFGGFDCTNGWAWSRDKRSALDGPADVVALTVEKGAAGAKVENFAITAASPSDLKAGGSSIGVAVDDAAAELVRCDVTASDAADGPDGQTPSGTATKGADAPTMMVSNACAADNQVFGGIPAMTTCDDGASAGGVGGLGGIATMNSNGQAGADGTPAGNINHGAGADMSSDCADATKGKGGIAGGIGSGGSAASDTLSLTGITSTDNTDGKPGTRGQGGGGGGGAMWGTFCTAGAMTVPGNGASGGGGGAGGCGGKGGGGGKAGGSSIAIVSLGTKLVLTEVTLVIGKGGKGGAGTAGQTGGVPGAGAFGGASSGMVPSKAGCQGATGGTGGDGGPGGGGRGGHAIGIAYASAQSAAPVIKTFMPGTPGAGGTAGTGAPMTSTGAQGAAAQCWDFAANTACK
jgi:hypothetical protein